MAETLDLLGMAHGLHGDPVSAVDYFGRAIRICFALRVIPLASSPRSLHGLSLQAQMTWKQRSAHWELPLIVCAMRQKH